MKTNSERIKTILVIFLPIILVTSVIVWASPQKVSGINFKMNLNEPINRTQISDMKKILDKNGWNTEYPAKSPFGPENDYDTLLIDIGCSKIYLVTGNGSFFYGIWCYNLNILTDDMNIEKERQKIIEKVDEVGNLLDLNYSIDSLTVDDNDFELIPIYAEFLLYGLCVVWTISSIIAYLLKGDLFWKKIMSNEKNTVGFFLLGLGLIPIWMTIRFHKISSLSLQCYIYILFFILLCIIGINLMRREEVNKNHEASK